MVSPAIDTVLPVRYVASVGPLNVCPCQYGPSGHCRNGRHEKCQRTWGWERHGQPEPETYVVGRDWSALTPVWRVGTACRWLCPCVCHTTVAALFDPPPRRPGRLSLTGGNQRIASTDRLRRDDPAVPDLFEGSVTSGA